MLRIVLALWLAIVSAGCGNAGGNPAFRATGEVIALGGGDAGASKSCASCHGLRGEGDGRLAPRLAGLNAGYLHRQLDDYVSGRRDHAEMRAIARRLSGDDRAKVSAYYAALPATGSALAQVSALYTAKCAECHGVQGEGAGPGNPPLAGQPPAYIAAQLEAWRSGKRRDPLEVMLKVSRELAPAEFHLLADHGAGPHPPADRYRVPAASR